MRVNQLPALNSGSHMRMTVSTALASAASDALPDLTAKGAVAPQRVDGGASSGRATTPGASPADADTEHLRPYFAARGLADGGGVALEGGATRLATDAEVAALRKKSGL
jgi:hypothetical protein